MAINKNHEFEELNGIKCAIVEKQVSRDRCAFLEQLLTYNGYTVIIQASAPPKAAAASGESAGDPADTGIPVAETFTIGVTDVMFNWVNAIFGRVLKTPEGHVVTLAYWREKEKRANDGIPYFENSF